MPLGGTLRHRVTLEVIFETQLNDAWIAGADDLTECAARETPFDPTGGASVGVGSAEIHEVEDIKHIKTKLQVLCFANPEFL